MESRRSRLARMAGGLLVATVVGVLGAWAGMALFAQTTVRMGPFNVALEAGFGRGETRLALPPFGSLTADTHLAPLGLTATLSDVAVEELTDVVNDRGIDGLAEDVEHDARDRLRDLAVRAVLAGGSGALVLALLVFRDRWPLVGAAFSVSLLAIVLCEILALSTFRPAAFAEPRYSGTLALAPDLIGPAREATGRIEDLRAGLAQIVDGTVRAYTSLQDSPLGGETIRVLHISDIHASPLGMDFAQRVADGFDVDLVIDTGDITSFATPVENLIVSRIPGFQRPYVFVRGSHDSIALQAAIAQVSNAVVLDGRAEEVAGLTVYGLGHPAFTPARGVPVDGEEFAELARSASSEIAADLEQREEPVDVIAVHDDRMAEGVAGRVPLVVSGHFHETRGEVENGTLFLRIATTGGSGAGIFRGLEDIPFSAEVLYFTRGREPELIAYDVIEQLPDSGSLTVQRVTVNEAYPELSISPSPSLSGPTQVSGTAGGTGAAAGAGAEPGASPTPQASGAAGPT